MFERQVLNHFSDIEHGPLIRELIRSDQMARIYRGPIKRITFWESTVIDPIKEAVWNRQPLHLVPFVPNFLAVDSVLYDLNDPDAVITCIQITINVDHDIVVSGLRISKAGSNVVHCLKLSALPEASDDASCLLCHQTWRPLSMCKSWMVILPRANGLERWINMY